MLNNQLKHIMDDDLTQLSVDLWASNRNLPSEISWTLDQDLHLNDESFKVSKIKRQMSFTQPIDIPTETVSTWRLMNLFSSNFIPIDLHDSQVLTQQIKNNLYVIYEITRNEAFKSQINAITHIEAKRTSQVQRVEGRLAAVTGLHFIITLDELMMSHTHPYLWGCILAIYLTGFTPLNHYLALTLKNKRGDVIATYNSLNG
jgi:type VI protein secretion system component VasA